MTSPETPPESTVENALAAHLPGVNHTPGSVVDEVVGSLAAGLPVASSSVLDVAVIPRVIVVTDHPQDK